MLAGVDRYRVWAPLHEGARLILSYLGEPYSADYIAGLSGAAFRVAGICPCAPTVSAAMDAVELLQLLGYSTMACRLEPADGSSAALAEEGEELVVRVREEIDGGRPALVWSAFTSCEWNVVCGYDREQRTFLGCGPNLGFDDYASASDLRPIRCTKICPALGAVFVGEKVVPFRADEAERAALVEAVAHAHSQANVGRPADGTWCMLDGLACYDRWVAGFAAAAPQAPGMGDRYCLGVFSSTHAAAAGFLRELAARYDTAELPSAAEAFRCESQSLIAAHGLLFPGGRPLAASDTEALHAAAVELEHARDWYARGIDDLERAIPHLSG